MVGSVSKWLRHLQLALALLALPVCAPAHQLDEYLQATLVAIEPGEIRFRINLTPGVAVAEQILGLIDQNRDGIISTNESATYAELIKHDLVVRLDGRTVELKLGSSFFPGPEELRTGWGIIQVDYAAAPGTLAAGRHSLILENRHLLPVSVYLFNAAQPKSASVHITAQKRNENQSTGEITFSLHPPRNPSVAPGIFGSLLAVLVICFASARLVRKRQNVDEISEKGCSFFTL